MRYLTRSIWILSIVSLLTDVASEMLYPVMPVYLESIGFSVLLIGILEGIAEATAGLSKGYFGKLSDVSGKRAPFVQLGYALSAISKPMLAAFTWPLWIFAARTMDRFGKGIRSGARDAILSGDSTPATKGRVFGFHRSMDTLGAAIGPSIALLYLYFYPGEYKALFLIAFAPGVMATIATMLLKDKRVSVGRKRSIPGLFSFLHYWKQSPAAYRKLVAGLLVFALFNGSDVFLLLKAKQAGLGDTEVIGVYIFFNLVYALFGFPAGVLADKFGLKTIFLTGLALFSVVYFGMAFSSNLYVILGCFALYGIFSASTEGISKAWISNISDPKDTATAIGTFTGLQSISALIASGLTGLIWYQYSSTLALVVSAIAAIAVLVYLLIFIRTKQ